MANHKFYRDQGGNAVVVTLVVLAVVAVGVFAYLSGKEGGVDLGLIGKTVVAAEQPVSDEPPAGAVTTADNPVLVSLGGDEVRRQDVIDFINEMPAQIRQQLPPQQLFSMGLEQLIGNKVVDKKLIGSNLDNNADVQKQFAQAKKQIVRAKFIELAIDERLTEDRLTKAYEQYRSNFPEVEEGISLRKRLFLNLRRLHSLKILVRTARRL